jgi:hypothetical protein
VRFLGVILGVLSFGGCRFNVDGISGNGGATDLAHGDDQGAGEFDLAGVVVDMAGQPPTDLATAMVDMTPDPCGSAGAIAAHCVIGSPPTVDGNLADWPDNLFTRMTHSTQGVITSSGSNWQGNPADDDDDLSVRRAVRWDLTNLYVAIAVTDDKRETPNNTLQTQNDAAELFLDGLHDRKTTYDADNDWQLVYSADGRTPAAYHGGNGAMFPSGAQQAWGGTSPNWTLELAVPWSALGNAPVTVGRIIGFDVKDDDNDDGNMMRQRDLIMYYVAGNGGGTCAAPYCRTDAFGAVQLQGR